MADLSEDAVDSDVYHVYPVVGREHVVEGFAGGEGECWCGPDLYRCCTECDHESDCWACGGDGVVAVACVVPGTRVIVAHHFIPDGEPIRDRR